MAPGEGFEPPTNRLTADRSTAELPRNETGPAERPNRDDRKPARGCQTGAGARASFKRCCSETARDLLQARAGALERHFLQVRPQAREAGELLAAAGAAGAAVEGLRHGDSRARRLARRTGGAEVDAPGEAADAG